MEYAYDALGQVTQETTVGYGTERFRTHHTYRGWTTETYDQANGTNRGIRTDRTYDAFGNLTEVDEFTTTSTSTGATPYATTRYEYDAADRLTKLIDDQNKQTVVTYDQLGRRTTMVDPDLGTWEYRYDKNSNMIRQRDARNKWTRFDYDALDRNIRKMQSNSAGQWGTQLTRFEYHTAIPNLGRLNKSRSYEPGGQVVVENRDFDTNGQITHQRTVIPGSGIFDQHFSYGYGGQQKSVTYPAGPNHGVDEVVTTEYDQRTGLPIGLHSDEHGQIVDDTDYGINGQLHKRWHGNNGTAANEKWTWWWSTNRINGYRASTGTSTGGNIAAFDYQYDTVGNTKRVIDYRNSSQRLCYNYDALHRMTQAFTGNNACTAFDNSRGADRYNETYSYDTIHNLKTKTGLGTYNYQPGSRGKVTSTSQGATNFTYDANGNQERRKIDGKDLTLTYDHENRLSGVTQTAGGAQVQTMRYEANGGLARRIEGGVSTGYVGSTVEYQTAGGTETRTHHYYLGGIRVATSINNALSYTFNDHLNSTSATLKKSNNAIARQRYTPWGDQRNGDATITDVGYTGKREYASTGLVDMGFRSYDPVLGRFAQPDTIVGEPNNPVTINRYAYVANNPVSLIDPSGNIGLPNPFKAAKKAVKKVGNSVKKAGGAAKKVARKTVAVAKKIDVHTALDVAGMVPVVGEFADAANAGLYLMKGDYANAAISAAGMIPGIGSGGTAARLACKVACDVAVRAADDVAEVTTRRASSLTKRGSKKSGCNCSCPSPNSFDPGTEVLMADGTRKPIEDVDVGDLVLAADPETGEYAAQPVVALIEGHGTKHLVDITIDGETVTATDEHPFWVVNQAGAWVNAEDLDPGNYLLTPDGVARIDQIAERVETNHTVHNLTINDLHTYHVTIGDQAVLTHNSNCPFAAAAERNGGVPMGDGNYSFPNRRSATQAASEAAGDLGSARTPLVDGVHYKPGKTDPRHAGTGQRRIGAESADGTRGHRTDLWGHRFDFRGHVNVWTPSGKSHFFFPRSTQFRFFRRSS